MFNILNVKCAQIMLCMFLELSWKKEKTKIMEMEERWSIIYLKIWSFIHSFTHSLVHFFDSLLEFDSTPSVIFKVFPHTVVLHRQHTISLRSCMLAPVLFFSISIILIILINSFIAVLSLHTCHCNFYTNKLF